MTNKQLVFESALIGSQWQNNVAITISDGIIKSIQTKPLGESHSPSSETTAIQGVAIPAMVNVHSHAFQRGFAGLSEYRTDGKDSFWTWRDQMYRFVDKLSPDDVYIIARQLYLEMLAAGYSWVGEFHYLHNAPSGKPYFQLDEMSESVFRAAAQT